MKAKQIIVIRKNLKMRRGKECSQAAHASMAWITNRMQSVCNGDSGKTIYELSLSEEEEEWVKGTFTKVTLQVNSEEELLEIYNNAKEAGLEVNLITDSGKTEFNGKPTNTCLAIGPDSAEKIDPITKDLKLY